MSTPARVLIICARRIGDVLLATPLIRTCRAAWPSAVIDALVFRGTEGVLEGNRDLSQVIWMQERSRWATRLRELRPLWRRYDLALSVTPSDRARLYGWAAGRRHLGMLRADELSRKRRWLDEFVLFDDIDTHTVAMGLSLADLLNIPRRPQVVPPTAGGSLPTNVRRPYVVLHPYPKFNYKMWVETGWIELARRLQERHLAVVLTGSDDPAETNYCNRIAAASGVCNLAGTMSLAQTADLLRNARLYVGPDTVVTHLAAASGAPTVALFGPSNPVKWGPWPATWSDSHSPWKREGSGRQGNVYLLQGEAPCVPCGLEGCDRTLTSYSQCLTGMTPGRVLAAALEMLGPVSSERDVSATVN